MVFTVIRLKLVTVVNPATVNHATEKLDSVWLVEETPKVRPSLFLVVTFIEKFAGWKCEKCKPNHYGDPTTSNCKACECDPIGSESKRCDPTTGQCVCKERFVGRTCDQCEVRQTELFRKQ